MSRTYSTPHTEVKSSDLIKGLRQMVEIQKGHVPLHIAEREPSKLDYLRIEDNDSWPIVAHIHSESRQKLTHQIQVFRNGNVLCACEDCTYRIHSQPLEDGRVCKHVEPWRETLLIEYHNRLNEARRQA